MTLRVLEAGLYTLVVDFGRSGGRSLGVPVGGAADRSSLALGNALVGNAPGAAALEITLAGPTLEATCPLAGVVYGAPFELSSNRQKLTAGTTFNLSAGERLRLRGTPAGMRAYLCIRGGLDVPAVFGSRSGLAPLAAGAELPCQPGHIGRHFIVPPRDAGRPPACLPDYLGAWQRLRVLPGPQADWFEDTGFFESAEDELPAWPPRFTVRPESNRMGLRLAGQPLPVPERELVSEPVCPGSVQASPDGQCIVLGVDGQTIGGYPKIAQVILADLDQLGQLRPGDQVYFVRVSQAMAERAFHRQRTALQSRVTRLRC